MKSRYLKIDEKSLTRIQRIATRHKLAPQDVLDKILNDCVEAYVGYCTVTCGLCHMRWDRQEKAG